MPTPGYERSVLLRRKKRRYNIRRVKATWPYTVQEIAELLGVHKNAVLRWLHDGLRADRSYPHQTWESSPSWAPGPVVAARECSAARSVVSGLA